MFPKWPRYSWLKSTSKSMARPENGCLAMISNQWQNLKNYENNTNGQMLHNPGVERS
jgi:hypothetical protein